MVSAPTGTEEEGNMDWKSLKEWTVERLKKEAEMQAADGTGMGALETLKELVEKDATLNEAREWTVEQLKRMAEENEGHYGAEIALKMLAELIIAYL